MNRYYVFSVFIFLSLSCAFAQPEITQTDLLNLVNAKGIWEDSGTGDMPIDLKKAGPDQIWDFRNLDMGHPTSYEFALSSSKQSPYASKYPASDHVLINTLVSDPSFKIGRAHV